MLVSRGEVIYSHQIFYIFSFAFENLNFFLMDSILIVPIKVACIDMGMQPVLYVMWIEKSYLTQLIIILDSLYTMLRCCCQRSLREHYAIFLNCEQCISHLHLVEISRPCTLTTLHREIDIQNMHSLINH